jgi:hypothetical protein
MSQVTFHDYLIARDVPAIQSEPCTYTRHTAGSAQIIHDVPSCLPPFADSALRTDAFHILDPGPVNVRGFRAYTTVENGFFLEEMHDPSWNTQAHAARFTASGRHEDYEAKWSDTTVTLPALPIDKTIDEPIVSLCSAEPSNYGSWIYRILPKLISLPQDNRALFFYAHSPWQREMLAHFAPDRPFICQYPRLCYALTDAHIPTLRNRGIAFDDKTRAFYHHHAAAIPGTSPMRRIYMSRRNQKIRPMLNEVALEAELVARGFHIIEPEALPLADRIRVIRDAEVIVCPGGSGLFNLVFANNAKLVLDIEASKTWIFAHTRLMNSLELPHLVLIGDQVQNGNPHAEWTAPITDAMQALDQLL